MNKKNLFVCILLLMACIVPMFATETGFEATNDTYAATAKPFEPTSSRVMAMGGAGLGIQGRHDSFLLNPANLGAGGFKFAIPSITVTAYNIKQLVGDGIVADLQDLMQGGNSQAGINAGTKLLGSIGAGQGEVLTTDVDIILGLGPVGLAIQAQEKLHSFSSDGVATSNKVIGEINAAATLALGFRIPIIGDSLSIDLGASAQFAYRVYTQAIGANEALGWFGGDQQVDVGSILMTQTPVIAGYAIPISAGVNLNLPVGFRLSFVAKNFNGAYTFTAYDSFNTFTQDVFGKEFAYAGAGGGRRGTFKTESDWTLGAALTWQPSLGKVGKFIRPTIAIDFKDSVELFKAIGDHKDQQEITSIALKNLSAGAELRLLSFLDLRYGINQGYQSIGLALDVLCFHLDAAYYWQEFGAQLSEKPLDALSIRFSLIHR